MAVLGYVSEALPIVLGAAGTCFLVYEVSRAHRFEELSRDLEQIRELQALYALNIREFWIRTAMLIHSWDRRTAEKYAGVLSDDDIRTAVDEDKATWEHHVSRGLEQWDRHTAPGKLRLRRRLLRIGFVLLMAGLGMQFAVVTSRFLAS